MKDKKSGSVSILALASQPRQGFSEQQDQELQRTQLNFSFIPGAVDTLGRAPGFPSRTVFVSYVVGRRDTLQKIAGKFGVSLDTILKANPGVKAGALRIGMTLQVPPVSGTVYVVREGDTIESIADLFGMSPKDIGAANSSLNTATLGPGVRLIIPGYTGSVSVAKDSLPTLKGYFIMPTEGFNWGQLHAENAVDIAGVCGTPVVAAAEGLVVPDDKYGDGVDGWNGGYGKFVLLQHPGGSVRTRYAQLRSVSVSVGDYVRQGQAIGTMGDTGDASGCHVHFEVLGAVNPFVK